jgi:hypothetical protein
VRAWRESAQMGLARRTEWAVWTQFGVCHRAAQRTSKQSNAIVPRSNLTNSVDMLQEAPFCLSERARARSVITRRSTAKICHAAMICEQ